MSAHVVVDASVVVAALTDAGPLGRWSESVLEQFSLHAPQIVTAECANALRRLEAGQLITQGQANGAARDCLALTVDLYPYEPLADRVWQLRANVSCYDGWYVALAEALDLPLATLDARLANAPGPACRFALPQAVG